MTQEDKVFVFSKTIITQTITTLANGNTLVCTEYGPLSIEEKEKLENGK